VSYSNRRPDPDALLGLVQAEEAQSRRGRLKIFFGGCAGTGKTYAMLSMAQERLREGLDVVAGIVETHGRSETQKLLLGLPIIPMVDVTHKNITLKEFNLDDAKTRKPAIMLVDELAHTNAPGSRHPKRWQDIEELLAAGIDVYTTLNVQHLESLSDLVAGVTGVRVKETVPDSVFDTADDITLVDIPTDELLKRLAEGKVYIADMAKMRAAENFFKKNNIIALRELALRRTAERVDAQMDAYNVREGILRALPVSDKVMVCLGPDPLSAKLVRTAKRMAVSLKAPWIAVYVENLRHYSLSEQGKAAVESVMRMAERMGAKTVVLQGSDAAHEIVAYARESGITKIILGKPARPRWREVLYGSLADKLIRRSGTIDIYVVTGDAPRRTLFAARNDLFEFKPELYALSLLAVGLCTGLGILLHPVLRPVDQALIYLAGVVPVAARLGRGPSLLYALLAPACFNFFFIPPLYTLEIYDRSYWMTLLVMLVTSLLITDQASKLRLQAMISRRREHHTQTLYTLTRILASTRGQRAMSDTVARHIEEVFNADVTVWMPDAGGHLAPVVGVLPEMDYVKEMAVLQWCFDNQRAAGRDTVTMPSATGIYLPLAAISGTVGVIGILPKGDKRHFSLEEISSLETIASLLASAMERANNAEMAEKSKVEAESEKLRSILLSTVSHDLRTPLASITGAASSIAEEGGNLTPETMRELGRSIHQEADRLSRIVTNLLDVTSLESGTVKLNIQPYFIEEIIGSALTHLEHQLAGHKVATHAEANLPMVMADGVLIEQVLANLLENAAKYTPAGSTITLSAAKKDGMVQVTVADNGAGIPAGDERKIFDKFYTTAHHKAQKGTGLGLAICRGVIAAHGGNIKAENQPEGGAAFHFTLPIAQTVAKDAAHDAA
jgi:two-component system sensor histidine kinase KdpD